MSGLFAEVPVKMMLLTCAPEGDDHEERESKAAQGRYTHTADCDCAEAGKVLTRIRPARLSDGVSMRARIDDNDEWGWR